MPIRRNFVEQYNSKKEKKRGNETNKRIRVSVLKLEASKSRNLWLKLGSGILIIANVKSNPTSNRFSFKKIRSYGYKSTSRF